MAKIFAIFYVCSFLTLAKSANVSGPTWCPESHQQLELKGYLFKVCMPMSCTNSTNNTRTSHCEDLSIHFQKCQKVVTPGDIYVPDINGTIRNRLDNSSLQQGEYMHFFQANKWITCASNTSGTSGTSSTSGSLRVPSLDPCMSFQVPQDGYRFQSDKSVFVTSINSTISEGYFSKSSNGSELQVCYPRAQFYELLNCEGRVRLPIQDTVLLPDLVIQDVFSKKITFQVGHYLLAQDESFVVYCSLSTSGRTKKQAHTFYLYGVVSIISAVCLLLALVAHMFYPRLNYHTKSILCLSFSLLMMYIAICVRNISLNERFSLVGNIIIFTIQYVFGLSSFLWLNILAFDLWRVFSRVRGPVSTEASRRTGKRWFLIKCIYAWGIPVIMCIPIIFLQFYREIQSVVHIYVDFDISSWLTEGLGIHLVFYIPIIIILVCNSIFFGLTTRNIRQVRSDANNLRGHTQVDVKLFQVYLKLFVVMGLSWFAEFISYLAEDRTHEAVWYFLDLINLLQGVFIFLVYVCKKKTLKMIKKRLNINSRTITAGDKDTSSTPISEKSRKVSTISLSTINSRCDVNSH